VFRGRYDLVVARGFGPPAVTAECAAPFLELGGRLVVSDPPDEPPDRGEGGGSRRWPTAPLAALGLAPERSFAQPYHYQALRQVAPCPDRYPRRTGVPRKRPLFAVPVSGEPT
jgi:16S rRNA (guanine527-N7)-methyltransferase